MNDTFVTDSIYQAGTFAQFFSDFIRYKKAKNHGFSYEVMCGQIKARSASGLAMIANGRRLPSLRTLEKIANYIGLDERQKAYAHALIQFERESDENIKEVLRCRLDELRPLPPRLEISFDELSSQVPIWLYGAIMVMTRLPGFENSAEWIASRFVDVSPDIVDAALQQMLDAGVLVEQGTKLHAPPNHGQIRLGTKARQYWIETFENGLKTIDMPLKQRRFAGMPLRMDPKDIDAAFAMIREFIDKFSERFDSDSAENVFHFGTMLYNLTPGQAANFTGGPKRALEEIDD